MRTVGAMVRVGLYLLCLALFTSGFQIFSLQPLPRKHTVQIMQMKFNPTDVKVHKGDTVEFINKDMVTHDVTETSGKLWKSPPLAPGKSWHMVASQSAGYYCSFHPVMKGQITVE